MNSSRSSIRALFTGIEGELIDTEQVHFDKWFEIACATHALEDRGAFEKIWRKEMIGIGDKGVYNILSPLMSPAFSLTERECEDRNNTYYLKHLSSAKILEGLASALKDLRTHDVPVVVVTHAPEKLTALQLGHLKKECGAFAKEDILLGERKNEEAYAVALNRLNARRAVNGLKLIEPEEVLVLDNSPKYLDRAVELGMRAVSVAIDLPEYLQPSEPHPVYPSMTWTEIRGAVLPDSKTHARINPAFFPR